MKIKAISIWQPWASLIAVGAKQYETRSWATSYRGPLLICAVLTGSRLGTKEYWHLLGTIGDNPFWTVLRFSLEHPTVLITPDDIWRNLPFGQAVAIVELTDCFQITVNRCGKSLMQEIGSQEFIFGDFRRDRYAWKLENVRAIEPFPVKGRQGLFEVELPKGIEI